MLLPKNRVGFKLLAVVVALALVMPLVMMPVGAAQAQENFANVTKVQKIETIIRFEQPLTLTEVDKLIKQHKITPIAIQYIAIDGSFSGGFGYKENLFTSLSKTIAEKEKDIKKIRELIKQETDERGKQIMKRMLNIQEKVLETLKNQSLKIHSLEVIVEKDVIDKIQRDVREVIDIDTTCTKYPSSEINQKTSSSGRFAPDDGEYFISPEWLGSEFRWLYDNPDFGISYEHEFRIEEQRYTGIVGREWRRTWNTNLPVAELKVEDNEEGQNYDEFAVKTLNPGGIREGEYYWVWIDVEPEGKFNARYQLEGETARLVWPPDVDVDWEVLSSGVTRPSDGVAMGWW
ncbi:hypothetical protein M1N70_03130 [Peptococcaceae bacterium]|nr:hypothetical protein [Peptococcaceae bacterium]